MGFQAGLDPLLRCCLELFLKGIFLASALLPAVKMLISAMLLVVKAAMLQADTVLVVVLSRCLTPPGVRII